MLNFNYHFRSIMQLCTMGLTDGGGSEWLLVKSRKDGFRISAKLHENTIAHLISRPGRYLIL
jgi:hypothetical protein